MLFSLMSSRLIAINSPLLIPPNRSSSAMILFLAAVALSFALEAALRIERASSSVGILGSGGGGSGYAGSSSLTPENLKNASRSFL
ncbi:MAG: hypothetical protein M1526_02240 [Candidatus Thermoplasmatota archaeon]|nr:hypothetical protein [Candidatus Thermoplasmatota archaeon]